MKMYRIRNLLLLIFLWFGLACSKRKNTSHIIINPRTFIEEEIYLSKFADSISYIPIDSVIKFSHILDIEITDDFLFLGTNPGGILAYNHLGEFVRRIGNFGEGPGEYKYPFPFTINLSQKKIYLLDGARKQVSVFTYAGKFLKKFLIPEYDSSFSDIEYFNDHIYLFSNISYGYAKYNWVVTDTMGNYCSSKLNSVPPFKSMSGSHISTFKNSDYIYYWNHYNDTIFQISKKSYGPAYLFGKGEFRLPAKYLSLDEILKQTAFKPIRFVDTRNYLFLIYSYERISWSSFLDKSSGQFFVTNKLIKLNDLWDYPGIENDLDNGIPFVPYASFNRYGNDYLLGWRFAYVIKNHVLSKEFQNAVPRYPEKKKELEKLAKNLSENNNPVLMLVKLKK